MAVKSAILYSSFPCAFRQLTCLWTCWNLLLLAWRICRSAVDVSGNIDWCWWKSFIFHRANDWYSQSPAIVPLQKNLLHVDEFIENEDQWKKKRIVQNFCQSQNAHSQHNDSSSLKWIKCISCSIVVMDIYVCMYFVFHRTVSVIYSQAGITYTNLVVIHSLNWHDGHHRVAMDMQLYSMGYHWGEHKDTKMMQCNVWYKKIDEFAIYLFIHFTLELCLWMFSLLKLTLCGQYRPRVNTEWVSYIDLISIYRSYARVATLCWFYEWDTCHNSSVNIHKLMMFRKYGVF